MKKNNTQNEMRQNEKENDELKPTSNNQVEKKNKNVKRERHTRNLFSTCEKPLPLICLISIRRSGQVVQLPR